MLLCMAKRCKKCGVFHFETLQSLQQECDSDTFCFRKLTISYA